MERIIAALHNLGRDRRNLAPALGAHLCGNNTRDARRQRFFAIVDENASVVIEGNGAAVGSLSGKLSPHNHSVADVSTPNLCSGGRHRRHLSVGQWLSFVHHYNALVA